MPVTLAIANGQVSLLSAVHAHKILCYTKYTSIVQKLSNKESAKVICRLDRLRIAHSNKFNR